MNVDQRFKHGSIDLEEAYDIIEKSQLIIMKWTLSEDVPTNFVSDNIRIFGYAPEDFYTGNFKDYWDFLHPDDRERVKNELYQARAKKVKGYMNQYRVVCADKSIRWVEEWVVHEYNKAGNLTYEKGILRDITESFLISEKLKESELRYKSLFDNAPAVIFIFNQKGQITGFNNSFRETMLDGSHLEKLNISLFLGESFQAPETFFDYCIEHSNERLEISMKTIDGNFIQLEIRNTVLNNQEGMYEIQVIGNDITEKKLAESRIKYLTEHDALTGLYNRLYFDKVLQRYESEGTVGISIVVGDVNGLKMVNDAFGHKQGDNLLVAISEILTEVFDDENDIIARLSGDEFAILTLRKNLPVIMDRIHAKCKLAHQYPFQLDISLGYSTRRKTSTNLESVFREADHAMYKKKLRSSKYIKSRLIQSLQDQLSKITVETSMHCNRMKRHAMAVGKALNLSDSVLEELELSIMMHDIGLVSVPPEIINKPGKLTATEMKEVMKHCEIGYHLLVATPNLAGVGEYVLSHHEHYDGKGYPQGLKGMEIPLISRIITVVDAFDAMTTERPYRASLTYAAALEEIVFLSGQQFDPGVVHAFVKSMSTNEMEVQK